MTQFPHTRSLIYLVFGLATGLICGIWLNAAWMIGMIGFYALNEGILSASAPSCQSKACEGDLPIIAHSSRPSSSFFMSFGKVILLSGSVAVAVKLLLDLM